jgi:DNA end-binding protein Ku
MAARSVWKGYLKLSLVSCAVALYPATASSSERVSFHELNRATGHRVKRQFADAEIGAVVETEDQVKGYEIGKGEHLIVEDDELAAIAIESSHTIDIDSLVPRADIDERYLESPYYLGPAMSTLARYQAKRDFGKTPEPSGRSASTTGGIGYA